MKILMIMKYPPIQGGVSADCYWTAQLLLEMGHDIHVLTNADEVEQTYCLKLSPKDLEKLTGYRNKGSITVTSTTKDKRHIFIPQNNPSVSKLCSLGCEIIESWEPDLIWTHYLEPYGVVTLMLSKLFGIPYVFRHAGSDIGRLMQTPQLQRIYQEVIRGATLVLTHPNHHERFLSFGVPKENLTGAVSARLPEDLFFPTPLNKTSVLKLGVYGKTGEAKGTGALLSAMRSLANEQYPTKLVAHWGGRDIEKYVGATQELAKLGVLDVSGFIPHWNIPDFIRSCDAVLFLENRFSISFHHPFVPLEVLSCGRLLITTEEIASKIAYRDFIHDGENAFVINGEVNEKSVRSVISRAGDYLSNVREIPVPTNLTSSDLLNRIKMYKILERVAQKI